MNLFPGQIIETDKLGFRHEGLIVEGGMVIHSTPGKGVTISSLANFSGPEGIRLSTRYKPQVSAQRMIYDAYRQLEMKRPWYPWNNCQHFISEIAGLKSDSPQWRQVIVSAFVLGSVFTLLRTKA